MAIPDFQSIMLPLLKLSGDNNPRKRSELTSELARTFTLTEEELSLRGKSGPLQFDNRVQWAVTYLKKAGLLHYPHRGIVQITPQGSDVLKAPPGRITINYLKSFDGFNLSGSADTTDEICLTNSNVGARIRTCVVLDAISTCCNAPMVNEPVLPVPD